MACRPSSCNSAKPAGTSQFADDDDDSTPAPELQLQSTPKPKPTAQEVDQPPAPAPSPKPKGTTPNRRASPTTHHPSPPSKGHKLEAFELSMMAPTVAPAMPTTFHQFPPSNRHKFKAFELSRMYPTVPPTMALQTKTFLSFLFRLVVVFCFHYPFFSLLTNFLPTQSTTFPFLQTMCSHPTM